jgi:hypothetical protein
LWVIFALLDPDPATQINADPFGSGSGSRPGSTALQVGREEIKRFRNEKEEEETGSIMKTHSRTLQNYDKYMYIVYESLPLPSHSCNNYMRTGRRFRTNLMVPPGDLITGIR